MTPLQLIIPFAVLSASLTAHEHIADNTWQPSLFSEAKIHAPSPIPDRVVLTWNDDPATTQAITWRTDTSIKNAVAQIAIANSNGRALKPETFAAETTFFESNINQAHYHTITFTQLIPDTLYTYRVGDGLNWSEYFHFQTASVDPKPFSFIYFGDAQNEIKTHWSRVFREAFREAPRAAFTLHAGDLINHDDRDEEWGEWHDAPAWVNGTIPVIATPGNHEYYRVNPGPADERLWYTRDGSEIQVDVTIREIQNEQKKPIFRVTATSENGQTASIVYDDDDKIVEVGPGITEITGFTEKELLGTEFDKRPLDDRRRDKGTPAVSRHWRPQFSFPLQNPPKGLEETCYYIDYQGTRIISLDSSYQQEAQVTWLREVLSNNENRWTILTFHHPIFSPAKDRDNRELRELWKPLLDEFKVDLVLTGHDHTYTRTGALRYEVDTTNIPTGYQQAYDPEIGTVYVVSVSGPKMYNITKGDYAVRVAEETQLYQVIEINSNELKFKAYTATGKLYDAFTLKKRTGKANELIEIIPPENRKSSSKY